MIYLRTGANGAGKTLLTLRDVREKSVKESRPVFYNGRFELVADFGWTKIDVKDWESAPDGAIFLFDECHNDFPIRDKKEVPRYVSQLAEHRRRGFDFFLITQHPDNIDPFIRRLIGSPGWHQHLKRASGAPLVSVLEWPAVNNNCQKNGAGKTAAVKMVTYPKEVYDWYVSTSLDTAKLVIPKQVWFLGAAVILIPLMGYFAVTSFTKQSAERVANINKMAASQGGGTVAPGQVVGSLRGGPAGAVQTTAEYFASLRERLPGFAHTAARYDALTVPTTAPFPAACIQSKKGCDCYSQQATRLVVPVDVCKQIVATGYFVDWDANPGSRDRAAPSTGAVVAAAGPSPGQAGGPSSASPMGASPSAPVPGQKQAPAVVPIAYYPPTVDSRSHPIVGDLDPSTSSRDGEIIAMMRARR